MIIAKYTSHVKDDEMNINDLAFLYKIETMNKKIQQLSLEAESINNSAKSGTNNYGDFKHAAKKFEELANIYEEYLSLIEHISPNKTILLVKANMYHEKYDYNISYGQYYSLIKDFQKATSFYNEAVININEANYYITESLKENLSKEERESANHDYNVWSLDLLLIEAAKLINESNSAINSRDYAVAYDKTKALIDISKKIYCTTISKPQYFTYEDRRKYKAQIEALYANLFSISNLQNSEDYNENPSRSTYINIILYMVHSYEYTVKAIEINNFWPDYKIIRDNLYNEIFSLICSGKKDWPLILQKSNSNTTLIEIMNVIDSKYYKKITNTGGLFNMNVFKNIVKAKGNVVVNNGNSNNISVSQSISILSSSDINKLKDFIDYLKNSSSDAFTPEEYIDIISKLTAITSAETYTQQELALKNWNTFKVKLSQSALKFLSLSSDIITIGTFLKNLLNL